MGAEIFHQTADTSASTDNADVDLNGAETIGGKASTGFSLGGSYDFDEHNHLLFSGRHGSAKRDADQFGFLVPGLKKVVDLV